MGKEQIRARQHKIIPCVRVSPSRLLVQTPQQTGMTWVEKTLSADMQCLFLDLLWPSLKCCLSFHWLWWTVVVSHNSCTIRGVWLILGVCDGEMHVSLGNSSKLLNYGRKCLRKCMGESHAWPKTGSKGHVKGCAHTHSYFPHRWQGVYRSCVISALTHVNTFSRNPLWVSWKQAGASVMWRVERCPLPPYHKFSPSVVAHRGKPNSLRRWQQVWLMSCS